MTDETKVKAKEPNIDRIAVTGEGATRLTEWMAQLQRQFQGIRIKRSDLVEWLILTRAPVLSPDEIRDLGKKHYDEMDLANWAIKQLKDARSKGRKITLEEVLKLSKSE